MRHLILLVATLACSLAPAQGHTDNAKALVVERMKANFEPVEVTWGPILSWQVGDEVAVVGFGVVQEGAERVQGVFTFDVRMFTQRRMAPRVNYAVQRWANSSPVNETYLGYMAKFAVRLRIENDVRTATQVDFAKQQITKGKPDGWIVVGSGTYSGRGGYLTGAFTYEVHFDEPLGSVRSFSVTPLASNPGVGWGGQHNAFTEGVAQAHAAEYVRSREGSSVQVQFTGPVSHITVAKGIDRVSGRGQWRKGASFQWADFRYDIQVGIEDGKIHNAVVNLVPDIHSAAEDQKFITFAQSAVRRDFRAQSPAQPTFLSSRVTTLPFGKKSVSGEFSAGGKRYAYEVVMDASTTRTDRVTISPKG